MTSLPLVPAEPRHSIVVALPTAATACDFVVSGTAAFLGAQVSTVVLTPFLEDHALVEELSESAIRIEELPIRQQSRTADLVRRAVRRAGKAHIQANGKVETLEIRSMEHRRRHPLREIRNSALSLLIRHLRLVGPLEGLCGWVERDRGLEALFVELGKPLVVIYDPYHPSVRPLLAACRRVRCQTVGIIRSWDNLASKGPLPIPFSKLIVWNQVMREQALYYYPEYESDDICAPGVPIFDHYLKLREVGSRAQLLKDLGTSADSRIILLMLGYPVHYPNYLDHVEMISQASRSGRWGQDVRLVVRIQPGVWSKGVLEELRNLDLDSFIIDDSEERLGVAANWDKSTHLAHLTWLVRLLSHADVMVNYASTTTIEAALFDVPNITIAFDGHEERPYLESCLRFLDFTHYRWILGCGGNRVVENEPELLAAIDRYLDEPSLDREGRRRIVRRVCGAVDGNAGRRAAEFILRTAEMTRRVFSKAGEDATS